MRLLYVADGRSPITLAWLEHFSARGDEVHLVSTRPCSPGVDLASLVVLPLTPGASPAGAGAPSRSRRRLAMVTWMRHWIGPIAVRRRAPALAQEIRRVEPDLVHALRIPFEGMLAAAADPQAPVLLSVWGNDFTLHAPATPLMRAATRRALRRADGLHADCRRDERLADAWGLHRGRPTMVLPGNGGVRRDLFRPPDVNRPAQRQPMPGWIRGPHFVVDPRGFRAYVQTESFFRAAPRVLDDVPDAEFAGVGMMDVPEALRWAEGLHLGDRMRLLPSQDAAGMAALFRGAAVSVSPSVHDGTPNTLLEAMACGCMPVAGDLESIREWIVDGDNGLLVDPRRPNDLARAIVRALKDDAWRSAAAGTNLQIIAERADRRQGMQRAERFYRELTT